MLVGRCSWELSGRKLQRKIKKSQLRAKRSGGTCCFFPYSDSFISIRARFSNRGLTLADSFAEPEHCYRFEMKFEDEFDLKSSLDRLFPGLSLGGDLFHQSPIGVRFNIGLAEIDRPY
jgi:hypothetical protein